MIGYFVANVGYVENMYAYAIVQMYKPFYEVPVPLFNIYRCK